MPDRRTFLKYSPGALGACAAGLSRAGDPSSFQIQPRLSAPSRMAFSRRDVLASNRAFRHDTVLAATLCCEPSKMMRFARARAG
jgi:hypothetical protein